MISYVESEQTHYSWTTAGGWAAFGGGGGSVLYTNAIPMPTAFGGLPVNRTFNNESIQSILDDLLYPYVSITANSLTADISNNIREKGNSITAVLNFTANYTLGSAALVDIDFQRNNVSQQKIASNTWSETVDVTDTTVFKAIINDGTSTPQRTRTYTFVYPFYYGTGPIPSNAADAATQLVGNGNIKNITTSGTKTHTLSPNNEVYYFGFPAAYGSLSAIIDTATNFDYLSSFDVWTSNITGLDATTQSYLIYTGKNLTSLSLNLRFET